jgi:hypothetical protein
MHRISDRLDIRPDNLAFLISCIRPDNYINNIYKNFLNRVNSLVIKQYRYRVYTWLRCLFHYIFNAEFKIRPHIRYPACIGYPVSGFQFCRISGRANQYPMHPNCKYCVSLWLRHYFLFFLGLDFLL